MSNQKKNLVSRYRSLLLLKEPYEMTYWKKKLNSPYHKLQMAVKHLWMRMHTTRVIPETIQKRFPVSVILPVRSRSF
ncbi:MAG: hypothetical protein ACHQNT_11600 [Bacteroidia bacterium]